MKLRKLQVLLTLLPILTPALALAQTEVTKQDESITHQGLTGLFNVISPDTLMKGEVSFGLTHRNYDRELTDLDSNDLSAAVALGLTDRIEIGGAYVANRQNDFDQVGHGGHGTFYNGFPSPISTIENGGGDLVLGLKLALAQMEASKTGFALIGKVKIPTGKAEAGRGTGGPDFTVGAAAGVAASRVGLYGNAGYTLVGDGSSEIGEPDLADTINWGAGVAVGGNSWARLIGEVSGEMFTNEPDGFGEQEDAVDLALGFKIGGAGHGGVTFGAAYVRNLSITGDAAESINPHGWVGEVSFTSTPPPPPVMPETRMDPPNNPPTVTVAASPREVYPSYSAQTNRSTVSASAADPDGDPLSYAWTTSGGRIDGGGPSVVWYPPDGVDTGSYTVSVRVSDGRGGEATASDTITVKADPEYFDGRVQFDFDRYDLDDEDRAIIGKVASHLAKFPELKLTLEGHTCYIATEEYNMALGQQRADSIRDALSGLGVDQGRVRTISYGEARPWKDNAREITRRYNRRGEFRFKFGQ